MNYGLKERIADIQDYIFGASSIPQIPLQSDSNWEKYLPWYEPQAENFESNGCVVWGTQNCIETLYKRIYGIEPNYSENFTYLLTPVDPDRGSDPNDVAECIRHDGLINNALMRVPDTKEEFLNMDRVTGSLRAKGLNWLQQHTFLHEWVWRTKPKNYMEVLKEALKYSPLAVSVSAWNKVDGVYVSYGDTNNHCCMLYKFDDEGYPWVFDSYDHSKKKLSKDHNVRRAKRFYISNKKQEQVKSLMERVIELLQQLFLLKKKQK